MKSRKLGFLGFGKSRSRSEAKVAKRSNLRAGMLESLERREMMASDFVQSLESRGFFVDSAAQNAVVQYLQARTGNGSSGSSGNGSSGEYDGTSINVTEAEPNNGFSTAQLLPFTNNSGVVVNGSSTSALDDEYFAMNFNAGDIVDVRLQSGGTALVTLPFLTLFDASRKELVTSQWQPPAVNTPVSQLIPLSSPLSGGGTSTGIGDVVVHYVIPATGKYYLRVSDVATPSGSTAIPSQPVAFQAVIRRFRSTMEAEPAGTKQILYLDFEGGFVNRNILGQALPGSARLSPTRDFLQAYGLEDTDEAALIDAVTAAVKAKFTKLGQDTTNPNFSIDIRNSKDDPDMWGQPNVTRVIIGGTFQELVSDPAAPSGILGISSTIDPGNFSREDTVVVMHDVLVQDYATVPISSTATRLQIIAELMAFVIAHEGGHSFGVWHQDPTNSIVGIMDRFYSGIVDSGAGVDGIFGTSDDKKIFFTNDKFDPTGGGVFTGGGQDDSINWLGWALTTGQQGGHVQGVAYADINLNRSLDASDTRLSSVQIYADLNNNGSLDSGEFSAITASDGSYDLLVPSGASYTIRSIIPTGYRAVAPSTNSYTVNVTTGNLTGRNFGFEQILATATGRKWNDVNGNGLRDTSESGVAGVWIYYDLDGDGRLDIGEPSIKSKTDGTYTLPNIGAGTYTIREVIDPGWVQTYPGVAGGLGHTITLTGNAVTDALVLQGLDFGNQLQADFGDAPETYGSASAGYIAGLSLGTAWDSESAAGFSSASDGDDLSGSDDEDGVTLAKPLVRGSSTNGFVVTTTNTTGQTGYLSAWMDFNHDGVFDSTEKINPASFTIPSTTALGAITARFRYGLQSGVGPTGYTSSGEVEDYQFFVADTSSIAVGDTDTVPRNGTKVIDVLANDFAPDGDTLTVISTTITTTAGGTAVPTADGKAVFYTAPQGFVGRDTFQYTVVNSAGVQSTATVLIDVSLFFENPVAVDDSFDLPANSIDYPLNVLANDIEGQNGALSIISVVQPDKGGTVTIATGGKSLRYTPPRNFGGTEFVTYTVSDSAGNRSTATVTLHTLAGDRDDDQVLIQLKAVDLNGNAISAIQQGQDFKIQVYVDDLRFNTSNPGTDSGVFAAYFDLLYNLQLVSTVADNDPASRFNFDVSFLGNYTAFTTGDASVPGVINEFGATFDQLNMLAPDPLPMAEITFTARSPGVVDFTPDPADVFPRSDTLLFNVPGSAVPVERIRYIGTQLEVFGDGVEFPVAVDDSTKVFAVNSSKNVINVMANDITGSTGVIEIIGKTDGAHGFVAINTMGTSSTLDDVLTYTPATNFSGFDQFTYTIQDARGIQSTATVTVHVGVANSTAPDSNDIVDYELVVTDLSGNPIDQVTQGQQFQLRAFVTDLRTSSASADRDTRGVFAAYQDVLFNRNLVSPVLSTTNIPNLGFTVAFGALYNRVREGDIRTSGVLNEIGAVATFDSPEPSSENPLGYLDRRIPLFTVTMTADRVGDAEFFSDPVDVVPLHEVLTYDPAQTVTPDKIHFGYDTLKIVSAGGTGGSGEFHNSSSPLDVNNDGHISPIDALLIINMLNSGAGGSLGGNGGGEGESHYYPDTNNDNRLSPIDALLVINSLNNRSPEGEGEAAALIAGLFSVPAIESASNGVSDSGNLSDSINEGVSSSQPVYGPVMPANYYSLLADSVFNSNANDEMESVLDELVSDVDLSWNSGLNG